MVRYISLQLRGKTCVSSVLLGIWLSCFLSILPLHAAQIWEEGRALRPVHSLCCQCLSSYPNISSRP